MNIGKEVLATYRVAYVGNVTSFEDHRTHGVIDSRRLPLGFYWVKFTTPDGEFRQMNHESEIGGDPRTMASRLGVLAAIRREAQAICVNMQTVVMPERVSDVLDDIQQDEVIL